MILFLQILVALLAVVLVILVLLQQGKGSDLGSAFGGGSVSYTHLTLPTR